MTRSILLLSVFILVLIPPAWSDGYWHYNYHGSGRDTTYSQKIGDYYDLGFIPHTRPVDAVGFNVGSSPLPMPPPIQPDPGKPDQYT
ncbi:MAG: hypothetical protein KGJ11_07665, partial [Candidatus Omnitrophica bacterium]|nr:hypothetical protein [Candidatus Omnitrophota bacterium]